MSRLGCDIGGVITRTEQTVGPGTTEILGAIDGLAAMAPWFESIWLVSKCGPAVQEATQYWLSDHDFFGRTGIDPSHVLFCAAWDDKVGIARELGLTHFVDNRPEVLAPMRLFVRCLFLFGARRGPAWLIPAPDWSTLGPALLSC